MAQVKGWYKLQNISAGFELNIETRNFQFAKYLTYLPQNLDFRK